MVFVLHEVPFPATSDRRSQVAGNGNEWEVKTIELSSPTSGGEQWAFLNFLILTAVKKTMPKLRKMSFLLFYLPLHPPPKFHAQQLLWEQWKRREEQHMLFIPFFQDNRPIKLLSSQQLRWSSLYMQLQCFERLGINVQTTFADCSQTRLCRVLILVAN